MESTLTRSAARRSNEDDPTSHGGIRVLDENEIDRRNNEEKAIAGCGRNLGRTYGSVARAERKYAQRAKDQTSMGEAGWKVNRYLASLNVGYDEHRSEGGLMNFAQRRKEHFVLWFVAIFREGREENFRGQSSTINTNVIFCNDNSAMRLISVFRNRR